MDEAGFIGFLKVMFAQKRKTVSNNLKLAYDKAVAKAALTRAEIAPTTRAEAIALPDMARLYRELKNGVNDQGEGERVMAGDERGAGSSGGRTVLSAIEDGAAARSAGISGARRQARRPRVRALGVIAPHAGYVYSGAVAGAVYAHIEVPRKVIVLCPNHTGIGRAAGDHERGQLPHAAGRCAD